MESKDSVITLQLGHYANYVGAHFWNLQEAGFVYPSAESEKAGVAAAAADLEVNHSVLFREGFTTGARNNQEVTFTPRLVSVDLKNALGSLPVYGDLYDKVAAAVGHDDDDDVLGEFQSDLAWGGDVMVTRQEACKNDYQKHLEAAEKEDEEEDQWTEKRKQR